MQVKTIKVGIFTLLPPDKKLSTRSLQSSPPSRHRKITTSPKSSISPCRKGSSGLWYTSAIRTKEGSGWNGRLGHPSNFVFKVVFKKNILISGYSVTWLSLLGVLRKSSPNQLTIFSIPAHLEKFPQ